MKKRWVRITLLVTNTIMNYTHKLEKEGSKRNYYFRNIPMALKKNNYIIKVAEAESHTHVF